jgi:hypothetical protein
MQMETTSASNCLPRLTADSERAQFLAWLNELIREHGAGEYLVQVRADGSVVVKRPRKPLEFEWR